MEDFKAFAQAQSIGFGDLTVESDESELAIYGRLSLTADAASGERLDHLIAVLTKARADLASAMAARAAENGSAGAAPETPSPLPSIRNPFA